MKHLFACVLIGGFLFPLPARAGSQLATTGDTPVLHALRLEAGEEVNIDGRLDEEVWGRAQATTDFRQSEPETGTPATERTEVRIVFDSDSLYIGVALYDSDPNRLLGNQMVRDGALSADDRFMWMLDPFYDQTSGYFFEINPAGAMGDAQLVPAQGGGGFGMTENRAWDGIWTARVTRHDEGWNAEIEIPFRTLNFDPQAEAWGANFQRTVRRKNEESFWTGWGLNQGLFSLPAAGRIEGIREVTQGRGLDIKPYLIGTYTDSPGRDIPSTYQGDVGLDLFYNLTPQLKANFTLNTDFAQTEVDDRQVNLTRFRLFFPEKRDFFLEGAGNFDFSRDPARNLSAFFSRRIGLTADGQPQKIDYGGKLTGRAGDFDLGFLQVRTAGDGVVRGEDFTVLRTKRNFFSESYAGLIYTRRATRESSLADRHTIGADIQIATSRFRGSQNLRFAGYYMKTPNDAKAGDDSIYGLRVDYPNDLWVGNVFYRVIQRNADPAVGFVDGNDYRKLTPRLLFRPRPRNNRWIRQVAMGLQRADFYTDDTNGKWAERSYHFMLMDLSFHSGDSANLVVSRSYERLLEDFRIGGGIVLPAGSEHHFSRFAFRVSTAPQRKISGAANASFGTFYSGHRRELSADLNMRPRPGLFAALGASFNRVELAEGSFSTKTLRGVFNAQFSPFMSISNNIQYDSVSRVFGWQFRFRWILKPGNDIYLVWLNNSLNSGDHWTKLDRSLATKLVYTHRF